MVWHPVGEGSRPAGPGIGARVGRGIGRGVGVVLWFVSAVLLFLGLVALLYGLDSGEAGGGLFALGLGAVVGLVGYALVSWGARPMGLAPRPWVRRAVARHRFAVAFASFGVLMVVFAAGGVALLRTGADPSAGSVFLAGAVFFGGTIALVEVGRRGGGTRAQYLAVGSGIVGAVAVLLTLGVGGDELRELLQYGIACTAAAVATAAGARARR